MSANENETLTDIISEIRAAAPFQACPKLVMRLADRIEAAWKREIPQPDPDWKTICEKCKDGEILPDNCEYFGEPNGCNSPTYGEHPPVYNAAAIREALKNLVDVIDRYASSSPLWWHNGAKGVIPLKNAKAALAEPPRNCDRFSAAQLKEMFENEMVVYLTKEATDRDREIARVTANSVIDVLFAPSTEGKEGKDGK